MKPFFPIFIDVSEMKITVVGGGKVAARRIETLLAFAEDITVISPEVLEEINKAAEEKKIRWFPISFQSPQAKEIICRSELVLAATNDSACNEQIAALCRERKIPVNVSHKKELCDFYFPAVAVQENIVAGITASGLDHGQARRARMRIEKALAQEQHEKEYIDTDEQKAYLKMMKIK